MTFHELAAFLAGLTIGCYIVRGYWIDVGERRAERRVDARAWRSGR